jgi:hypothetical protein
MVNDPGSNLTAEISPRFASHLSPISAELVEKPRAELHCHSVNIQVGIYSCELFIAGADG